MFVNGFPLRCPHCSGESFKPIRVTLDTSEGTFLGLDWTNALVRAFVCETCGRIEWFRHARASEEDRRGAADCTRCGMLIPASAGICPNCGEPK